MEHVAGIKLRLSVYRCCRNETLYLVFCHFLVFDSLFENAKNGPTFALAETKVLIERKILLKEKKAFLGFFSLRGSYQYGMFGNEATYKDITIAPYLTYTTHAHNVHPI